MEILIDEAGSFAVTGAKQNSWCVVAAYATPQIDKAKYKKVLINLKSKEGYRNTDEVKIHKIKEKNYFLFLRELGNLNGILLCTATDSNLNEEIIVKRHQKSQVEASLENLDRMKYESGKNAVLYLQLNLRAFLCNSISS